MIDCFIETQDSLTQYVKGKVKKSEEDRVISGRTAIRWCLDRECSEIASKNKIENILTTVWFTKSDSIKTAVNLAT